MTTVIVNKIPSLWSRNRIIQTLKPLIRGPFKAVYFTRGTITKSCYLVLSEGVKPENVIRTICSHDFGGVKLNAVLRSKESKQVPIVSEENKSKRYKNKPDEILPLSKVFVDGETHIISEVALKYTGLHKLNEKSDSELIKKISWVIFERLSKVLTINRQARISSFHLTKAYRRLHPHFGDFQLILSTLHQIEDSRGKPRTQIVETDLMRMPTKLSEKLNIPKDKIDSAVDKFTELISNKVHDHIASLDAELTGHETEEELARKRVRTELKKVDPYIPLIVNKILQSHTAVNGQILMAMYGEPSLPTKEQTLSFLSEHKATNITRSKTAYNLLTFNVPKDQYCSVIALDGTVLNGLKLTIRPYRKVLPCLSDDIKQAVKEACERMETEA